MVAIFLAIPVGAAVIQFSFVYDDGIATFTSSPSLVGNFFVSSYVVGEYGVVDSVAEESDNYFVSSEDNYFVSE